jgi:hypothetical protein
MAEPMSAVPLFAVRSSMLMIPGEYFFRGNGIWVIATSSPLRFAPDCRAAEEGHTRRGV